MIAWDDWARLQPPGTRTMRTENAHSAHGFLSHAHPAVLQGARCERGPPSHIPLGVQVAVPQPNALAHLLHTSSQSRLIAHRGDSTDVALDKQGPSALIRNAAVAPLLHSASVAEPGIKAELRWPEGRVLLNYQGNGTSPNSQARRCSTHH